jgi:trk system potassium uptake protein TrkH
VVDTGSYWSFYGHFVIMLLVQVGGLGFASSSVLVIFGLRNNLGLTGRLAMQNATGTISRKNLNKLGLFVLKTTLLVEAVGAFFLFLGWVGQFGPLKALWWGIFHSIATFNNAGFDLAGTSENQFPSLVGYADNYVISLTIPVLIVIGGIGFVVIADLLDWRTTRRLSVQTKAVVILSALLIFGGALIIWLTELNNPRTLGPMPFPQQVTAALFQSVAPRTGGINTINLAEINIPTYLLLLVYMFIGGGSGSTAGGLKVSTLAVILASLRSILRNRETTVMFGRTIPNRTVNQALAVGAFYGIGIVLITFLITIFNNNISLRWILFEVISAFSTVGISEGATPLLSLPSQILIIIAMLTGRLGPIIMLMAISRAHPERFRVNYPEEDIPIG